MTLARLAYRVQQFWKYTRPASPELDEIRPLLSPAEIELFLRMQPAEQAHSLEVSRRLIQRGKVDEDLQVAALLHDVGKSRFHLQVWDRAWIVLTNAILPRRVQEWGNRSGGLDGALPWQRPFIVAWQHPAWGAELAAAAGCSPRAISLIRRHQDKEPLHLEIEEDLLLAELQAVDDES
jgi:hypothetical protein